MHRSRSRGTGRPRAAAAGILRDTALRFNDQGWTQCNCGAKILQMMISIRGPDIHPAAPPLHDVHCLALIWAIHQQCTDPGHQQTGVKCLDTDNLYLGATAALPVSVFCVISWVTVIGHWHHNYSPPVITGPAWAPQRGRGHKVNIRLQIICKLWNLDCKENNQIIVQ